MPTGALIKPPRICGHLVTLLVYAHPRQRVWLDVAYNISLIYTTYHKLDISSWTILACVLG